MKVAFVADATLFNRRPGRRHGCPKRQPDLYRADANQVYRSERVQKHISKSAPTGSVAQSAHSFQMHEEPTKDIQQFSRTTSR